MHLVKLIERRFPQRKAKLIPLMVVLSISLLLLGLGLILVRQ